MALQYPDMVRFFGSFLLLAALAAGVPAGAASGQQSQSAPAKDQMFSGTVTAMDERSLTVVRTGSKESKTFAITPETKFEGPKPHINARVNVRFVPAVDGDRALRVIVRPAPPPKK